MTELPGEFLAIVKAAIHAEERMAALSSPKDSASNKETSVYSIIISVLCYVYYNNYYACIVKQQSSLRVWTTFPRA